VCAACRVLAIRFPFEMHKIRMPLKSWQVPVSVTHFVILRGDNFSKRLLINSHQVQGFQGSCKASPTAFRGKHTHTHTYRFCLKARDAILKFINMASFSSSSPASH